LLQNGSTKNLKISSTDDQFDAENDDAAMALIENEIAALLEGKSALVEIELLFRALHRRGYVDEDDFKRVSRRFDQVYKALANDLTATRIRIFLPPEQPKLSYQPMSL
jgi:hypothetical protein